ncbi:MAG: WD40 repeat domain-containing protein [Anaerolineae bacterium]|nr:WD40 repeat domain-containing protein [Anaerolineae bacterium]
MKQRLLLLLTLFLTACAVAETGTAVPLTITPGVTLSPYSTASTPLAQVTATTEPTDIPPIPAVTTAPTDTPQPTPTPIPPPTGRIYFMWDPLSDPDDLPNPVHNLYVAIPGDGPSDWHIETVLTELVGIPVVALSPDKTKLAFTALEDANNDGNVSFQGAARYLDAPNIFVYSLIENRLERITSHFPWARDLTWSNTGQRLAYQNDSDLFVATHSSSGDAELWHSFSHQIQGLMWSPTGDYLAVGTYSGEIYLLDSKSSSLIKLNLLQRHVKFTWSPNGLWLVSSAYGGLPLGQLGGFGVSIINITTLENFNLVESGRSLSTWSPDSRYLAFSNETKSDLGIPLFSSLRLWNTESNEINHVSESVSTSGVLWSPDSQAMAVGLLHEDRTELIWFNLASNSSSLLLTVPNGKEIMPLLWSPDEEWLLFYDKRNNESSLKLIHRTGGEIYQVLDMTKTYTPYGFFWLLN